MFTSYLLRHWLRHLLRHLLRYRPFVVIFQLNTLLILQIAGNTRSFSKLLQTFWLQQIHEIWYVAQGNTNNHSIHNFLFYNNLQQILVQILEIAVNTLSFRKLLQTFLMLQIDEIWYGTQGDTNNAICKVSAHSIYNFLFYNNLQQILVLFTAFAAYSYFFYWNILPK